MKKILIILGAMLLIGGGVLLAISITSGSLESAFAVVHHDVEVNGSFNNIKLDVTTADVILEKSTDDKCLVSLDEKEKYYHNVEVENDTLTITSVDEYSLFERALPSFGKIQVKISLPADTYNNLDIKILTGNVETKMNITLNEFNFSGLTGNLNIENMNVNNNANIAMSTGNISLSNINCSKINVDISSGNTYCNHVNLDEATLVHTTGKVKLETVRGEKMNIEGSTGKVSLQDAIFEGHLYIETTTGDVTFKDSDANTIEVVGKTSDVTGNILTEKTFVTETTTGKNKIPSGSTGNECKITITTGDIIITVGK